MTLSSSRPTGPVGDITAERDAVLDELARRSAGDPESAELCGYAGELSHRLYLLREDDDRDEELALAVEAFEHAFRAPGDDPLWSSWRVRFGHLRGVQYEDDGDPQLLQQSWQLLVDGVEGLPADNPDFAWERDWGRHVLALCARLRLLAAPDSAELLQEALRRHTDALEHAEQGSEEEAGLRAGAGYLYMQRALRHGDLDAADESARHYRALLDTAEPADVPHLRYSLGLAGMVRGRARGDREQLDAALDAFDTALTEARRAGGPEPEWAFEAETNALFVRAMIWSTWKDLGHSLAAEVELRRLLERPGAEEQLLPQYLDVFGRLLYERAAARDDPAGRDRGIALLRRAVDRWEPDRDGDVTATALFLALFQQARHHDDPDPARAQDVLRAAALILAAEHDLHDLAQTARMLDGWARFTLADHGVLPETDGRPEGLDTEQLRQTMSSLFEDFREGRAYVDFGEEEHLRGMSRDVAGQQRRIRGFEEALAQLRSIEPGSPGRAELAALMLCNLTIVDPDGTHITAEHRRELTEAVLQRAEQDPAWQGRAHAVTGIARLHEEMSGGSGAGLDEVLAHFDRAEAGGLGGDEHGHGLALARFMAQTQRGQTGGAGDDMDAGAATWRRLRSDPTLPAHLRRQMDLQQAGFEAHAAVRRGDLAAADGHIAALTEGHAALGDEDPSRIEILTLLENARSGRDSLAQHLGVPPLPPLAVRPSAAELRRQARRLPRDHRAWVLGDTGMTRFVSAVTQQDGPGIVAAIGLLREAHELCEPGSDSRLRYANGLGIAHCALSEMEIDRVRRRERLAKGIALLEGAFAETGGPEHRLYADTGLALARAHRTRDDLHRRDRASARSLGLKSLRGHAWAALLQSGTDHATVAAAQATGAALEVAGWCLKDDRPEEALQALDACRGLVLHATLTSATVPDLLTATGHTDLAADWRTAGADATEPPADPLAAARTPLTVPSTLRRRVLAALTGTHQAQLLDPPTPDEIAEALRTLTKDALVYLVPATDDTPGTALVVTSQGTVHAVPLPTLTEDAAPLKEYGPGEGLTRDGTPRDLGPVPGRRPSAPATLRAQLDRLCGWAWYAAMRPLLEAFEMPAGRLPRLVLVPMGRLGLVPWHAAWQPGGPRGRQYALQAAEISYAASARLLCQVAARPAAEHTGAALIVGNPTGDLRHAGEEADAVQRAFYPEARFLGRRTTGPTDGPGTPGEVLRWLRESPYDGGVLHLACHASVAENARRSAHLTLYDGQLAAEEITGAGGDRLGLVLLAACRSHVSGRGHNEAYSLATAFLAAGARSVVGSLWPVPDEATSVLMFLTHHFLRTHAEPPARALRRAQLWMLNPDRELPPEFPEFLAERARGIDPHDLSAWAGFTHLGR
ncbi:CHAT domain-containing protein [Streptomyces sp. NPDC001410]|uniref:CHAT domain-containing protein n=1 Tax=Streptomyces sp. NPDC001410 TaxID=3364574 RepID=UPI003683647C